MSLRVIFCTHPAHGHLNPLLPVAHACRDAGHAVLFATAPRFCETVRSRGFQCRPAGLDYLWSEPMVSFPELAHAPRGPEQIRWLAERIARPRSRCAGWRLRLTPRARTEPHRRACEHDAAARANSGQWVSGGAGPA